ncbi:hypothetical protein TGDOM2_313418 [Toxoplasma gondii GAB2-2007-GAL-DOM2]|uniref:Uncharacterized protein n=1 Tax=Toxoplasma gondii GAB2-2007-GAL-DOM2 TaxID=1130820 RepID=A0A086JZ89_TOXGO|nr:hypothetical protein TGDOM2_313418 [Toxoplasma gondii GAB2-2007-GAL-DOM2]
MGPACLLLTKTETSSAPVQASRRGQVHPREKSLHSHVAANLPSRIRVFLHPQARETYRQERLILSPPSRRPETSEHRARYRFCPSERTWGRPRGRTMVASERMTAFALLSDIPSSLGSRRDALLDICRTCTPKPLN